MENKNKIAKRNYNSDKTFVQISKELHIKIKDYCKNNNIKVKDFLENTINDKIKKWVIKTHFLLFKNIISKPLNN